MCEIRAGERVLDIGCGTGNTLILLAGEFGARAVGVDLTRQILQQAHERVKESARTERVQLVRADGGYLPLPTDVFDCAIVESVLVHTDAERLLAQIQRTLTPAGRIGANEMTYLEAPPRELEALLEKQLGIVAHQPEEWGTVFERAGMRMAAYEVKPFSLWEQLKGHIAVDGLWGYLSALVGGLCSTRLRSAFLNRGMLGAARRFSRYVGYGLYVAEKPSRS
jgi:ubiquinone/menaquinone biosynthesis C-methylase UbiE